MTKLHSQPAVAVLSASSLNKLLRTNNAIYLSHDWGLWACFISPPPKCKWKPCGAIIWIRTWCVWGYSFTFLIWTRAPHGCCIKVPIENFFPCQKAAVEPFDLDWGNKRLNFLFPYITWPQFAVNTMSRVQILLCQYSFLSWDAFSCLLHPGVGTLRCCSGDSYLS